MAPGGIAIVLPYKLFASCLEVINWSDYFLNIYGIADIVQDSLDWFIRHRALIQSITSDRSREDSVHFLLEFRDRERLLCIGSAHEPSCTVRRGVVPFRVAFACTDEAAVAHVNWDDEPFPSLRRDCTLAENHIIQVDIVMDSSERIDHMKSHVFDDNVNNGVAIHRCEMLCNSHVVDIVIEGPTLNIRKVLRNVRTLCVLEFPDFALDLLLFALCLEVIDQCSYLYIRGAIELFIGKTLIVGGDFYAQMATAGMDNEVQSSFIISVNLDEVITTAQSADRLCCAVQVNMFCAAQSFKLNIV